MANIEFHYFREEEEASENADIDDYGWQRE